MFPHLPDHCPLTEPHPRLVDINHVLPVREAGLVRVGSLSPDPSCVDSDIDSAEAGDYSLHGGFDGGFILDVGGENLNP